MTGRRLRFEPVLDDLEIQWADCFADEIAREAMAERAAEIRAQDAARLGRIRGRQARIVQALLIGVYTVAALFAAYAMKGL